MEPKIINDWKDQKNVTIIKRKKTNYPSLFLNFLLIGFGIITGLSLLVLKIVEWSGMMGF